MAMALLDKILTAAFPATIKVISPSIPAERFMYIHVSGLRKIICSMVRTISNRK
jgi:hypothetical protein